MGADQSSHLLEQKSEFLKNVENLSCVYVLVHVMDIRAF